MEENRSERGFLRGMPISQPTRKFLLQQREGINTATSPSEIAGRGLAADSDRQLETRLYWYEVSGAPRA